MSQPKTENGGLVIPSREFITEQQVHIVLHAINALQPFVLTPIPEDGTTRPGSEGRIAADNTLVALCSRLDKIMEEESRWSMSGTVDFYAELAKTQKIQQEFLVEQARAAKMVTLPHYLLRPTLARDSLNFYAIWGDASKEGASIIGIGKTPNEAMADFDAAFDKAPPEQLSIILENEKQTPTQPE